MAAAVHNSCSVAFRLHQHSSELEEWNVAGALKRFWPRSQRPNCEMGFRRVYELHSHPFSVHDNCFLSRLLIYVPVIRAKTADTKYD